jgi:hypothetical protein
VTLLELTSAYGVLANGGRSVAPYIINRVRSDSGQIIYERPEATTKVLVAPAQVGAINDMLNAALVTGTGKRAALPRHPAAGKTGTSQDFPRRLVRRLHGAFCGWRVGRQRRWPVDEPGDGRQFPGSPVARGDAAGARWTAAARAARYGSGFASGCGFDRRCG